MSVIQVAGREHGTEHRYVSHIQVAGRDGTDHGGQQAYSYSSHMLHTTIIVD